MIIVCYLIALITVIIGMVAIWRTVRLEIFSSKGEIIFLCIITAVITLVIILMGVVVPNQIIANLDTKEQQVIAQVVSKEESYTREGSLVNYTITYNYYVTVECETEEGVFSETFDDIDLYGSVKKGDTLEVILVIRYKNNGEIYDTTMYQIYDEE